ncbi:unnamed protein product, partial [Prunus brigantina]
TWVVSVRDPPREGITALGHPVVVVMGVSDQDSVLVEVPTRVVVLGAARGAGGQMQSTSGKRSRPQCAECGKYHFGTCLQGSTVCYQCGQSGHFKRDCPLRLQSGETITASDQGTGTQGRSQGTSSSGGVQTSGTSRGGSQQRGRGGRPKATGRVYTMT